MKIMNNISTLTQEVFQPVKPDKKIKSLDKATNHTTTAYKLNISSAGLKSMEMYKDQSIAILNTDALTYTKDLRIIKKVIL